jgi:hypothetical protein
MLKGIEFHVPSGPVKCRDNLGKIRSQKYAFFSTFHVNNFINATALPFFSSSSASSAFYFFFFRNSPIVLPMTCILIKFSK